MANKEMHSFDHNYYTWKRKVSISKKVRLRFLLIFLIENLLLFVLWGLVIFSYEHNIIEVLKEWTPTGLYRSFFYLSVLPLELLIALLTFKVVTYHENKKIFTPWMEAFFQGIERNPASIILTDFRGNILYTNKMFQVLSGYSYEEIYQKNARLLKSGHMAEEDYRNLWETISTGNSWTGEFLNKRKDGELYWVNSSISPIYNGKGEIFKYLGIQEDISLRKEMSEKLKQLASKDPLTGINNRRTFFDRLHKEFIRAKRSNHVFTLLMVDIDHFKRINDTYGHQTGDIVLKELALILKKNSREIDICARYGGEEFIIALPETKLDKAILLASRLLSDIEEHKCICDNPIIQQNTIIQITVSIGIAQWTVNEDPEETIKRADTLLYKAKENGRNRIEY